VRPGTLVVMLGTGTGVGKTYSGVRLLGHLRSRGLRVAARKPAQSFAPGSDGAPPDTDAELLARATGEAATEVCPPRRWYEVAMAPPMAASVLGRPPVVLAELLAELRWPDQGVDVGLVEGAGGVCSPIAEDADGAALARALEPDLVVVVTDAGLGTIHAVRSSVLALAGLPVRVLLNRYDDSDLHRRNLAWLRERDGLDVSVDPADLVA
jgi:dethiobiotin synthetase